MDLVPHSRDPQTEFEIPGDKSVRRLRASGLLWLINRVLFQPAPLGPVHLLQRRRRRATGWQILGDGTQPWSFTDEVGKFERAEDTLRAAVQVRQAEAARRASADWPDL